MGSKHSLKMVSRPGHAGNACRAQRRHLLRASNELSLLLGRSAGTSLKPNGRTSSRFAALSALTDLCFQERGEICGRGLLVACCLLGQGTEASTPYFAAGARVDRPLDPGPS
jgi:hypothetical protein